MISNILSRLPSLISAGLVLIVLVAFALAGQRLCDRLFPSAERRAHNELFSHAAQVVGVINAVLLALIVFAVWSNYDRAKDVASLESALVVDIARDAEAAGLAVHDSIVSGMQEYVETVISSEWPHMKKGAPRDAAGGGFGRGWSQLSTTYELVLRADSTNSLRTVVAEELVKRFNSVFDARRQRIHYSTHGSLTDTIWGVVLAGGLLSIACCWLLGVESRKIHATGSALVAASFGLVFFLIISIEWPYRGRNQIPVEQYCTALRNIHRQESADRAKHEAASASPRSLPSSCPARRVQQESPRETT